MLYQRVVGGRCAVMEEHRAFGATPDAYRTFGAWQKEPGRVCMDTGRIYMA